MSFIENLNWRYATKKFDERKIENADLEKILTAIQMAPSSSGLQPYHVVVVSNKDKLNHLKIFSTNALKFETCSHMLVFCYRTDMVTRQAELAKIKAGSSAEMWNILKNWRTALSVTVGNLTKNESELKDWAMAQTYLALGFGLAAAADLKIDSCPMEGFENLSFQKELGLPEYIIPCALLALGYRATDDEAQNFAKTRFTKEDLFTVV